MTSSSTLCHVCGFDLEEQPWGKDGLNPTFLICSCCGCEFGYDDATPQALLTHRQKWLDSGAVWFDPQDKPIDWSLNAQMAHIPDIPKGIAIRGS